MPPSVQRKVAVSSVTRSTAQSKPRIISKVEIALGILCMNRPYWIYACPAFAFTALSMILYRVISMQTPAMMSTPTLAKTLPCLVPSACHLSILHVCFFFFHDPKLAKSCSIWRPCSATFPTFPFLRISPCHRMTGICRFIAFSFRPSIPSPSRALQEP